MKTRSIDASMFCNSVRTYRRLTNLRIAFSILLAVFLTSGSEHVAAGIRVGIPYKLSEINSPDGEFSPTLSTDGLELYFATWKRPGGDSFKAVWVSRRSSRLDPWKQPTPIAILSNRPESNPDISGDGLSLYFDAPQGGGGDDRDLWVITRDTLQDSFGPPMINLGEVINGEGSVDGVGWEGRPSVSADELIIVFDRFHTRAGTLSMATRESKSEKFGSPVDLGINGSSPDISPDGLVLLYESWGGLSRQNDIVVVTRSTTDEPFGEPVSIGEILAGERFNTEMSEDDPSISADGSTLFFIRTNGVTDAGVFSGDQWLREGDIWAVSIEPTLNGAGETYFEDFDSLGLQTGPIPRGWIAENANGSVGVVDSLGLREGPLEDEPVSVDGIVNAGGSASSFASSDPSLRIATWKNDVDRDRLLDGDDVIADRAMDRALGNARVGENEPGKLIFSAAIGESPLRAFILDWDLEIWGGQPDSTLRGSDGGGYDAKVMVGNTEYYAVTQFLVPGQFFDTQNDGASAGVPSSTLIDGNVHSTRDITSPIIEINGDDGAVGNTINVTFNANYGDNDKGWISAIDNVRFRTLASGDADANGVVDVEDLLTLLAGQKFNQGVSDVTWEQGDFNADDQFNTGDLLSMLAFLSGTFPSDPYASEAGSSADSVADVIVNSVTGEITVDLAGHAVSAILIGSATEIFNGEQPDWDTVSQFPSTLPGELGNVLFTSTASGFDELGVVISAEFLGRDKEFYLQDLDLNILIASDGGALTKGNVIVVPEPSTWLLLFTGMLLVGWRQVATRRSPGKQ